jgi:COP9 signalosome complex subunit 1
MGHEDIGRFYQRTGKTQDAVEAYTRMRHEVSTVRHITESTRLLAEVAVERRTWSEVVSQGNKALGMRDYEEEKTTRPPVQVLVGIGLLGQGKFQEAAENFLGIEPTATYDWIASASDVAIYGGLLALATMDRFTLQKSTLENSRFRSFLEQEPNVRKSISLFINGRYSLCLANLEPIRPDLLLDIHMQKHVETIFRTIRRKCIVQYFMPFSCVTIKTLEREFSSGKPLEQELIEMIREGELDARIDAKAGVRLPPPL